MTNGVARAFMLINLPKKFGALLAEALADGCTVSDLEQVLALTFNALRAGDITANQSRTVRHVRARKPR